jgi:hypothetical protein
MQDAERERLIRSVLAIDEWRGAAIAAERQMEERQSCVGFRKRANERITLLAPQFSVRFVERNGAF